MTYAIIGAAMRVHTVLGCGFLEKVYQEALRVEFRRRTIAADAEVELPVRYDGELLRTFYKADFVVADVLVETKALSRLGPTEAAQIINYLKAGGGRFRVGLLINFAATSLEWQRFAAPRESVASVKSVDT